MNPPPTRHKPARVWRIVGPLAFALAGILFVTSAGSARGIDLRPANSIGLGGLVQYERAEVAALREQSGVLQEEIEQLSTVIAGTALDALTTRVDRLAIPAGLTEMTGDGLRVVLDDAPADQPVPPGRDPNDLVVHQQDLQAVVNALWAGGAEAIMLQGQRIVSTTGIKCVGNTVVLQGVPYSPPYRIVAVGDPVQLTAALDTSPAVQVYRQYAEPPINIGWELDRVHDVTLPAYDAALTFSYARPFDSSAER